LTGYVKLGKCVRRFFLLIKKKKLDTKKKREIPYHGLLIRFGK
jgi:hypothetical protein